MDECVMRNVYQETLAERSLVISPAYEGELWTFRWYVDPISNGLSKGFNIQAYVYPNGAVMVVGLSKFKDEEVIAQQQAESFIKENYERLGFQEEEY